MFKNKKNSLPPMVRANVPAEIVDKRMKESSSELAPLGPDCLKILDKVMHDLLAIIKKENEHLKNYQYLDLAPLSAEKKELLAAYFKLLNEYRSLSDDQISDEYRDKFKKLAQEIVDAVEVNNQELEAALGVTDSLIERVADQAREKSRPVPTYSHSGGLLNDASKNTALGIERNL